MCVCAAHFPYRPFQSSAIAKIGKYDWPAEWPTLFDSLIECINNRTNPHLFDGGIKCLLFFVEHLDTEAIIPAVTKMGPFLFALLADPAQPNKCV